ncbi:hypothetical protein [Streptomyces sp. CB03238]|uniref:tetratricopeptide repeat protein n=1 Tax=Streptomyces sp. CB03238 TaxID=1907777 RepID=UPI000A11D58D|nr:hypothetical protein [Streptomyces sp. CB03238]ORT60526.1 hypothetical protein BKD26_09180 [Streptomyces sp. CB03238]
MENGTHGGHDPEREPQPTRRPEPSQGPAPALPPLRWPDDPAPPPPPTDGPQDPWAAALGNASLLGLGYFRLGRRGLGLAALALTVALVWMVAAVAKPWCEVLAVLCWMAVTAHGWYAATRAPAGRIVHIARRVSAAAVAVTVIAVIGTLRADALGIESRVADAHAAGDCTRVVKEQDTVWFGHRVTGASASAHGDELAAVCADVRSADRALKAGLAGDTGKLHAGFERLDDVLADDANEPAARTVLDRFLETLPDGDPCETATVTDWLLTGRDSYGNLLEEAPERAAAIAPQSLLECGDTHMDAQEWQDAQARYRQLLDKYPKAEEAGPARKGEVQATRAIELDHVRQLISAETPSSSQYCSAPAKYSGAAPYREGTNRALFLADDTSYHGKLPGSWRTEDPSKAVLVVCAGEATFGTAVQTCTYEYGLGYDKAIDVTFHKIAIPVRVYELRTGRLVAERKVQIAGSSCPAKIQYESLIGLDTGPDAKQYVKESKSHVQDAFRPLIIR